MPFSRNWDCPCCHPCRRHHTQGIPSPSTTWTPWGQGGSIQTLVSAGKPSLPPRKQDLGSGAMASSEDTSPEGAWPLRGASMHHVLFRTRGVAPGLACVAPLALPGHGSHGRFGAVAWARCWFLMSHPLGARPSPAAAAMPQPERFSWIVRACWIFFRKSFVLRSLRVWNWPAPRSPLGFRRKLLFPRHGLGGG